MEKKTELPVEVSEEIEQEGERYADKYLNGIVNTREHAHLTEAYVAGATAYATKLHQAEEKIKVLDYDNKRLAGEVEGYKSAVDELKRWKINAAEELTIVGAYAHKHLEVNSGDSIAQLVMTHLNNGRDLLNEVFRKHEARLLPDRFIYEKIKTFLYGE